MSTIEQAVYSPIDLNWVRSQFPRFPQTVNGHPAAFRRPGRHAGYHSGSSTPSPTTCGAITRIPVEPTQLAGAPTP